MTESILRKLIAVIFLAAFFAAMLFVIVQNFTHISTESSLKLVGASVFMLFGLGALDLWLKEKDRVRKSVRFSIEFIVLSATSALLFLLFN